jgi:hypothetical protein
MAKSKTKIEPKPEIKTEVKPETKSNAKANTKPEGKPKGEHALITLLTKENPKRPGSSCYTRFTYYKTGMTVEAYLAAGGTRADIAWDVDHGFISLKG